MAATPDRTITDRPISVVLLGYGLAGRVFHGPLIETTPGLLLDAIVTSDPQRQEQAAQAYPSAVIYDSPEQAWASGHDLAVIGTPNVTHVPFATAALAHGLHCVVDKPVAPTAADTEALAVMADERGLLLVPFQNRRWDSDFLTVRAIADSGSIGRPHRFESRFERMRVVPKGGWRDSTAPADMGGMVYDLGAHLVDQSLALMGPVETVYVKARTVRTSDGSDDDAVFLLTHASGAVSQLTVSQIAAFDGPSKTLYGTRGGVRVDAWDTQEPVLASGALPLDETWGQEPDGVQAIVRTYSDASERTEVSRPLERGDYPAFYKGVAAAIRGEGPPPVLVSDVVQNMRVIDAAHESARTGQVVTLSPPAGHRA